jgi:hypothetical protein
VHFAACFEGFLSSIDSIDLWAGVNHTHLIADASDAIEAFLHTVDLMLAFHLL